MRFQDILNLPMSETDSTTVGEYYCNFINQSVNDKDYGSIAVFNFLFFFRVPTHPITKDQLIYCLDMKEMEFGSRGYFDSIKTYKDLINVWKKARPNGAE